MVLYYVIVGIIAISFLIDSFKGIIGKAVFYESLAVHGLLLIILLFSAVVDYAVLLEQPPSIHHASILDFLHIAPAIVVGMTFLTTCILAAFGRRVLAHRLSLSVIAIVMLWWVYALAVRQN